MDKKKYYCVAKNVTIDDQGNTSYYFFIFECSDFEKFEKKGEIMSSHPLIYSHTDGFTVIKVLNKQNYLIMSYALTAYSSDQMFNMQIMENYFNKIAKNL